jgi:hypothetical protein
MVVGVGPAPAASAPGRQASFRSPEEAVQKFVAAVRSGDRKALRTILGPDSGEIVSSGDAVADKAGRERFLKLYDEKNGLEQAGTGKAILSIGLQDYPFPIPVVKKEERWLFDTRSGKEEILNRRIGRNELNAMEVLHAYVEAQRDYASRKRAGTGAMEFARKIRSTPGKRDGLYWEVKEGEPESPLGPLAAEAAREGYAPAQGNPAPYHGYLFRILTSQGKNAEGGAFDYIVNGKMILGFGLVAYPAQYGSSGIMTFIVNQNGTIYQKDLGKNTDKTAAAMTLYDPDETWKRID